MKNKLTLFLLFLLLLQTINAQNDTVSHTNPIIFGEINIGVGRLFNDGLAGNISFSANYQSKKNLFTFRFSQTAILQANSVDDIFTIDPKVLNDEYAFLYGKRWIEGGQSLSVSLGVSYNTFKDDYDFVANRHRSITNHFGVPFEANIRWFKSEKRRYRLLELFPVGPETGFGRSIGFKLFGNISKQSYIGIGLVYGLGYHRYY